MEGLLFPAVKIEDYNLQQALKEYHDYLYDGYV